MYILEVDTIAKLCHEANRGYCEALGDHSQKQWEQASEHQRESARAGVWFIMRFPEATPEQTHESWLAEKQAAGWRYGNDKDEAAKTHPCMVPYDVLPITQRAKDHIFGAVVRACMSINHGVVINVDTAAPR